MLEVPVPVARNSMSNALSEDCMAPLVQRCQRALLCLLPMTIK